MGGVLYGFLNPLKMLSVLRILLHCLLILNLRKAIYRFLLKLSTTRLNDQSIIYNQLHRYGHQLKLTFIISS